MVPITARVTAQEHADCEEDHDGERKDGGPGQDGPAQYARANWQVMPCFRGFEGVICPFAPRAGRVFAQFAPHGGEV
jgi:hypothetical protein